MPNTLTVSQLQSLTNQLATTSPGASNFQSIVSNVYTQLSQNGYGYATLAEGVITCSTLSGNIAQNFISGYASSQGTTLTNTQTQKIELDLANQYVDTLTGMAVATGTVSTDITYSQALQFHTSVFENDGLSENAWTLTAPGEVLDSASMENLWQMIVSPNAATSNQGTAALYGDMQLLANVGSEMPSLTAESLAAAQWVGSIQVAGLTSVFVGSNACSTGSTTILDQYGNVITNQIATASGATGTNDISGIDSNYYAYGTGILFGTSDANVILGNGSTGTMTGSGNSVNGGSNGTFDVTGNTNIFNGGAGDALTFSGSGGQAILGSNATVTDTTANNTITTGASSNVTVDGNNVTVTNNGTGCTDGIHCVGDVVNSTGNTIDEDGAGDNLTVKNSTVTPLPPIASPVPVNPKASPLLKFTVSSLPLKSVSARLASTSIVPLEMFAASPA
jgi:hypothetical protein